MKKHKFAAKKNSIKKQFTSSNKKSFVLPSPSVAQQGGGPGRQPTSLFTTDKQTKTSRDRDPRNADVFTIFKKND